jgi:HSP20 family protein
MKVSANKERRKTMAGLVPSRKNRGVGGGNGGGGPIVQDVPTLMRRMRNEFDELFERFAGRMPGSWMGRENEWRWGLDVEDMEDRLVIRAEAPGFEPGDFDIQVGDNQLTLKASRKTETKGKEGESHEQCECFETLTLPSGIDKDKIEANYRNGVLLLTIPKTKDAHTKRITVKG